MPGLVLPIYATCYCSFLSTHVFRTPLVGPNIVLAVTTVVTLVVAIMPASLATAGQSHAGQTGQTDTDDLRLPPPIYPEAARLWKGGQPDAALEALEARLDPADREHPLEALVLRAKLLTATGRADESERMWRESLRRARSIRTYSRRGLIESLTAQGRPAEAAPILVELTRSNAARHRDLMLRVAHTYRESGNTAEAAGLYRQVIAQRRRGPFTDTARVGLAAALETDGDLDTALSLLRETRLLHWGPDVYEQASQDEQRLAPRLNRAPRPFEETEYHTMLRRLRNASRFELSLDVITEWQTAHPLTARPDRIEAERIATLYAQRSNEDAVTTAQRFYERFPVSGLIPSVRLTEFRLAVRMTNTERARRMGDDLWHGRVPGATDAQRQSAAVLLAAYLAAVGDLTGSLELYRELFQTSENADDQRAYLWRAGVAALRDGQDDRALTNLRGLVGRGPGGDLAPAGLYWLGAAEQHRDRDRAIRTFQTVDERFPFHYYGIRARERLDRLSADTRGIDQPLVEFPSLTLSATSRARAEYKAAMVLARAGLTGDSATYLRRLLDQQPGDRGLALLAARASADAEDYADVFRIMVNHFGRFLRQPSRELPDDFWSLVYPRPFWDEVRAAARAAEIDPILMVSLMRQESRFDPAARSAVGAVGLFQIMPYTATALAETAGVSHAFEHGVDDSALMQPSVNAAIAARLTGNLLKQFDGEIAPVIASYNAGEDRVAVWWSASSHLGEDVFVDSIPYSETRRFVREVLTNYAAYQRIYDDQ